MRAFPTAEDRPLRQQVLRTSTAMIAGSTLIVLGALIGGSAQTWPWLAGLVVDVAMTYLTSKRGNWRVHSAAHWSERFGLVVILALGESIVAIGVGVAELPISTQVLVGSLLAIALSVLLWWLYFDVIALAAEHQLARLRGVERANLAIDGYTCLHFLIIAGVVISALGVERVMHHVNDAEPLGLFAAAALFGGTSLYLAGHAAFWYRAGGKVKGWRLGAATLPLLLVPVGAMLPALLALAVTVALTGAVVVVKTVRHAQARADVRKSAHPSQT